METLTRASPRLIILIGVLTLVDVLRISHNLHLCSASPMSVISKWNGRRHLRVVISTLQLRPLALLLQPYGSMA